MRAVVFTDVAGRTTRSLIEATLAEAAVRPDLHMCGFVTASPSAVLRSSRQRASRLARSIAVGASGGPRSLPRRDLGAIAGQADLPILVADAGVNDPAFIDRLHSELRPELLLSYFCTQILRAPLLESMEQAVNYHDGLLPTYGGLAATGQSIYHGERASGFTFHRITTGIDDGPILAQGSVAVGPNDNGDQVDRAKVAAAASAVPGVLDKVAANDPGQPQQGEASYFSRGDVVALTTVGDPSLLTGDELHQRLKAFGMIDVTIDGAEESITELTDAKPGDAFAFVTSDGQWLRARRIADMPAWATTARRKVRSGVSKRR